MTEKDYLIDYLRRQVRQYGIECLLHHPEECARLITLRAHERRMQQQRRAILDPFLYSEHSIDYPPTETDSSIITYDNNSLPQRRSRTPQPQRTYEYSRNSTRVNINTQELAPIFNTRQSIFARMFFRSFNEN